MAGGCSRAVRRLARVPHGHPLPLPEPHPLRLTASTRAATRSTPRGEAPRRPAHGSRSLPVDSPFSAPRKGQLDWQRSITAVA
ncbi:hypothetical protein ACFPRL_22425 [Pseudoclavibacter helvolus]